MNLFTILRKVLNDPDYFTLEKRFGIVNDNYKKLIDKHFEAIKEIEMLKIEILILEERNRNNIKALSEGVVIFPTPPPGSYQEELVQKAESKFILSQDHPFLRPDTLVGTPRSLFSMMITPGNPPKKDRAANPFPQDRGIW